MVKISLETPVADQILLGFIYIQKLRLAFELLKEMRDTGSNKKELKLVFMSPCKSQDTEDIRGEALQRGK
jgi:hypothetical protein